MALHMHWGKNKMKSLFNGTCVAGLTQPLQFLLIFPYFKKKSKIKSQKRMHLAILVSEPSPDAKETSF
jgi:hypothetical protein